MVQGLRGDLEPSALARNRGDVKALAPVRDARSARVVDPEAIDLAQVTTARACGGGHDSVCIAAGTGCRVPELDPLVHPLEVVPASRCRTEPRSPAPRGSRAAACGGPRSVRGRGPYPRGGARLCRPRRRRPRSRPRAGRGPRRRIQASRPPTRSGRGRSGQLGTGPPRAPGAPVRASCPPIPQRSRFTVREARPPRPA